MEKLNGVLDAIEAHVRNRRTLDGIGRVYTADPGTNMEHWASAIRTRGRFEDVQEALDFKIIAPNDIKLPFITVAPKYKEFTIKADYYIAGDDEDSKGFGKIEDISEQEFGTDGGVIYFHAGTYRIRRPISVANRVILIGEDGTYFNMAPYDPIYPIVPKIQFAQYTGSYRRPTILHNIVMDNLSFNAIIGSSFVISNCVFRYSYSSLYNSTASLEGIIETSDTSDTTTVPSIITNCKFFSGESIITGNAIVWLINRVPIYHKYGQLHIHNMVLRKNNEIEKWFRNGVISSDNATLTKLTDCDLRTYDECVKISTGATYIDNCGFYREFDRSEIATQIDYL